MSAHRQILAVLEEYFGGLHAGDVARLRAVFAPNAVLFGEVKGQPYHRLLDDYLKVVADRKSPAALGEPFAMRTISIEVHGAVAQAVVRCPMLGFDYVDLLSLLQTDGKWAIVAKVFTHLASVG
jgi:hypothetical protein